MTCDDYRVLLLFYRPGKTTDLAAEDVATLEAHLRACPACATLVSRQSTDDTAVGRAFRQITVPGGLKDRLQARAGAAVGRLWWRKWTTRTAATVTLALTGLIGWGGYVAATKPALDTWQLASNNELTAQYPDRAAFEFLREQGIPLPLPEDFDFQRLTSHGFTRVQGQLVPVLEFRSGEGGFAKVYLLKPGQFVMSEATETQNSVVTVRLYRDRPVAGWTTVVVHTGNGLHPFLRVTGPQG